MVQFVRLLRQVRDLRNIRKVSSTAVLKKNDQFIIKSPLKDVTISNSRFLDRLWKHSASFNDHVAIESAETKKSYTYRKLQLYSAVFATSLRKKLGLNENDVVAVLLPNCPEFPVVAMGVLQAGCILTPINPMYKEFEICHQVSTTEPKVVVTTQECYETLQKSLEAAKIQAKVIIVDNSNDKIPNNVIRYSDVAENGEADFELLDKIEKKKDDIAVIPFSSGTTGLPKGVAITHWNLIAALEIMQVEESSFAVVTHGTTQDVVPCILPFYHIYGLVINLFGHLICGCKLVTLSKFSASLYFNVLKTHKPDILCVVPPVAILLGKHPDVTEEHFRNVRNMCCGAAPLSASDAVAVLEKSNGKMEINQGFGATETTSLTSSTLKGTKNIDYSSSGVPMANIDLKFIDPSSGNVIPVGETGELCIRSPTLMKGYFKNDIATKECMTDDGFFKTGDLGHYSVEHGLYISDRIKELIKVKGMQVAPAELEGVLRTHPAVQEAAVIGVPHEFYGESPKAFVIKKHGLSASPEEIQSYVAEKVAAFKKIEEVVFVDEIPKTTSGKILRKELKKMYA